MVRMQRARLAAIWWWFAVVFGCGLVSCLVVVWYCVCVCLVYVCSCRVWRVFCGNVATNTDQELNKRHEQTQAKRRPNRVFVCHFLRCGTYRRSDGTGATRMGPDTPGGACPGMPEAWAFRGGWYRTGPRWRGRPTACTCSWHHQAEIMCEYRAKVTLIGTRGSMFAEIYARQLAQVLPLGFRRSRCPHQVGGQPGTHP